MEILPAIDLCNGKVVRLLRGDFNKQTVYSKKPIDVADYYASCGAVWIHMVDLEGALRGSITTIPVIKKIKKNTLLLIEFGGGIRTEKDIADLFKAGVDRIVLGTKAYEDIGFIKNAVNKYGEKIAVGIDAKNGYIAVRGWKDVLDITVEDFIKQIESIGVKIIIYTDIAKDGTLQGPNIPALNNVLNITDMKVIASGGISCIEDVKALTTKTARKPYGVIIGKAIYEGKIDLTETIKLQQ